MFGAAYATCSTALYQQLPSSLTSPTLPLLALRAQNWTRLFVGFEAESDTTSSNKLNLQLAQHKGSLQSTELLLKAAKC